MPKFIYLLLGIASLVVFILFIKSSVALDSLYPQLQTNVYTNVYNYVWALVPLALVVFLIIYSRKKSRSNISRKQILILLCVFVGLLFIGWFLLAGPRPLSRFPSQQESQSQTSNWMTYNASKVGFGNGSLIGYSVKYPPNTAIIDSTGASVGFDVGQANCLVYLYPSIEQTNSSNYSDSIRWKEEVTINGKQAERIHVISGFYEFEFIVLQVDNKVFEFETSPHTFGGSADIKTCDLIYSTFTIK